MEPLNHRREANIFRHMKTSRFLLLLTAVFVVIASQAKAQSASNYFLKIEGIPGESFDETHRGEIEVLAVALGVLQPQLQRFAGGGASASKTEISPITITKPVDKSSPLLFLNCATGKRLPTATITARKLGEAAYDYFTITLSDVLISSLSQSASEGGITEAVSLSFSKLTLTYVPQNPDGRPGTPITSSFDLKANKPFTSQ